MPKKIKLGEDDYMEFQEGHCVPIGEIPMFIDEVIDTYGDNLTQEEWYRASYEVMRTDKNTRYDDDWVTIVVCADVWLYKKYLTKCKNG